MICHRSKRVTAHLYVLMWYHCMHRRPLHRYCVQKSQALSASSPVLHALLYLCRHSVTGAANLYGPFSAELGSYADISDTGGAVRVSVPSGHVVYWLLDTPRVSLLGSIRLCIVSRWTSIFIEQQQCLHRCLQTVVTLPFAALAVSTYGGPYIGCYASPCLCMCVYVHVCTCVYCLW